jgi:glycosyltransferase involved in cell wall biosynthesis
MTKKADIICIGSRIWDGDIGAVIQLMSLLAASRKMLYVEYTFTLKDMLVGLLGKNPLIPARRIAGLEPRLRQLSTLQGHSVYVLTTLPVLPINWIQNQSIYKAGLRINNMLVRHSIRRAMRRLKISDPVVINAFAPFYSVYNKGAFNEKALLYFCSDDIASSEWLDKHGQQAEEMLLPQIDAVLTTSKSLFKSKIEQAARAYLIENGADFYRFNQIANQIPDNGVNKVIGYIGTIDFRLDTDLLSYTIAHLPQYTFRFAGSIKDEARAAVLQQYANVEILGPQPYTQIPKLISQMDVCLIPFVCNQFTANIYPLKINEYLAAGKPVVMTPFADLSEFEHLVSICADKSSFASAIQKEIATDGTGRREARIALAKNNSWESRAQKLDIIIESLGSETASHL